MLTTDWLCYVGETWLDMSYDLSFQSNEIGRFLISVFPIVRFYELFKRLSPSVRSFQQSGGSDVEEERFSNIYVVPKLNAFSQYVNSLVTLKAIYDNALNYTSQLPFFFRSSYIPSQIARAIRVHCSVRTANRVCNIVRVLHANSLQFYVPTVLLFCWVLESCLVMTYPASAVLHEVADSFKRRSKRLFLSSMRHPQHSNYCVAVIEDY
jgi:hypothetical protein